MLVLSAMLLAGPVGCAPFNLAVGALAGADAMVAVPVFGRGVGDLAYSLVSGRDCSMVRLEQGRSYCVPLEDAQAKPLFCTRSLGVVDCWADPGVLPGHPGSVADAPALTPAQEENRTARWPKL